jgi:CBS domain-containing protein
MPALNQLALFARTAVDLMTPNPITIHQDAGLLQAADLLVEKDISAVAVLDERRQPVGVLSRTDIVRYFRDHARSHWPLAPDVVVCPSAEAASHQTPGSAGDMPAVRNVMTRAFLSVPSTATALEVVAKLLGLGNVHRLFVVDEDGGLVGVVSSRDVLRKLRRPETG